MKQNELCLGIIIYSLIITAGLFRTDIEKLSTIPWDTPIYSLVLKDSHPAVRVSSQEVNKALLASKVRQIFSPERPVSVSANAQDSIRQDLEKKWNRMASQPAGFETGAEPTPISPLLLGVKTVPKIKPGISEKKGSNVGEPTKS